VHINGLIRASAYKFRVQKACNYRLYTVTKRERESVRDIEIVCLYKG